MKKDEKTVELYLSYDENESGGQICRGQENDPWPTYEDLERFFEPKCLYRQHPGDICVETISVTPEMFKAKELYLLVVRYGSGDTFGSSSGNWRILGLFQTSDQAEKYKKKVLSNDYDGYKPWEGYFECLEGFEIHKLSVKGEKSTESSLASMKEYGKTRYFNHTI